MWQKELKGFFNIWKLDLLFSLQEVFFVAQFLNSVIIMPVWVYEHSTMLFLFFFAVSFGNVLILNFITNIKGKYIFLQFCLNRNIFLNNNVDIFSFRI